MQIRPLCPELEAKARAELNEDPQRIASDVQHIKDWLAKQPHLRARSDDQWIVGFLRGCKYSLERTKEKLDLYYSMRGLAPELFSAKPSNPMSKEIMNIGVYFVLPKSATPDAPRVAIIRPGVYDPDKYKINDIFSVSILIQRILMKEDDNVIVSGMRTILDLEGVTVAHYLQMTPAVMKRMAVLSQDASPMRMKGTHYINTPPGFETVFNTMKLLLNEKNRNRLYVHNKNYEEMYQSICKEELPVEYGGNGGTVNEIIEYWKNKIDHYSSWIEEDSKYGTDEAKRPGSPKSADTLFGVEGSFRQLSFD
uniref:CTD6 n=1 Tax=Heliconius melpomene TaxID=34740 RepID=A0A2H4RMP4_HELME|nr:CTD6 [Heliconius melpomene]